jgi:hypothetical protein
MKRREKARHSISNFDIGYDHTYWAVTSSDLSMARVVISRPVTPEAVVHFQVISCYIYGGRNGNGTGSSLPT